MLTAADYECINNAFLGGTDDYDLGPFFIRIKPSSTRCDNFLSEICPPFIVSIHDDNAYEGNESFILTIQPSLPAMVTVGEPSQTIVTIVDNDCKYVHT